MNNKTTKIAAVVFVICFALFISAMAVFTVTSDKSRYSYFENRTRAAKPEITKAGLLDGSFMTDAETYAKEYVCLRDKWLTADTAVSLMLGRPVVNGVVVTDTVLLPELTDMTDSDESITKQAEKIASNLLAHKEQVEAYGGHFLYVAVPCQYVCYEDAYPWYLPNKAEYTAKSSAALFAALDEAGVDYTDMLSVFGDGAKRYSSAIDNHFGMDGAYLTYREIIMKLNEGGVGAPLMAESDFTREVLPNRYLGSRTRKLLGIAKSDEKLTVLYPKDDIPFTRSDGGKAADASVYDIPATDKDALYGVYMGGDIPETVIDTGRHDLPTVLIYGDSFTNAVECAAWCSFDKMYSFDFRYYDGKTLAELISELRPDAVVCIRDFEAMLSPYANGQ